MLSDAFRRDAAGRRAGHIQHVVRGPSLIGCLGPPQEEGVLAREEGYVRDKDKEERVVPPACSRLCHCRKGAMVAAVNLQDGF